MASHHGARRGRPARGPAEPAAAGQRHGRPRAARPTCAASTTCATPSPSSRCGSGWRCIIGGAVWIDQWWSYLIAFVLMGPMYARFAISDARGGAQAALHQQAVERLRRQVDRGLSGLHAGAALPAGALRPPQGRVRARRAGHRLLRGRTRAHAVRCAGACSATPSASAGGRTSCRWSRTRCTSRSVPSGCRSSPCRPCCGPSCGRPPGAGGSTRCCGGCPG